MDGWTGWTVCSSQWAVSNNVATSRKASRRREGPPDGVHRCGPRLLARSTKHKAHSRWFGPVKGACRCVTCPCPRSRMSHTLSQPHPPLLLLLPLRRQKVRGRVVSSDPCLSSLVQSGEVGSCGALRSTQQAQRSSGERRVLWPTRKEGQRGCCRGAAFGSRARQQLHGMQTHTVPRPCPDHACTTA